MLQLRKCNRTNNLFISNSNFH